MSTPDSTDDNNLPSDFRGNSRHRTWAAAAAGLVAVSLPAAILAIPASAQQQSVAGTGKKLTPAEAKKWSVDLQKAAVQVSPMCGSKKVQGLSPVAGGAGKLVQAVSGADPCKIVAVFVQTAVDLRMMAAQRPYFGFTLEHKVRTLGADTCIARLTVGNKTRTVAFTGNVCKY